MRRTPRFWQHLATMFAADNGATAQAFALSCVDMLTVLSRLVRRLALRKVSIATTQSVGGWSSGLGASRLGRGRRRATRRSWLVWLLAASTLVACQIEEPRPEDAPIAMIDAAAEPEGIAADGNTIHCGERVCTAPAVCVASVQATRCRCPLGYIDVRGDGSDCRDVNECVIPGICGRNGKCTNTQGSYQCECAAPAFVALGNICVCASGYARSSDGDCLAEDGIACETDDHCLNHHCEGGTCCAVRCDRPAECQTSEAASCKDGKTCSYGALPNGTPCDDARACRIGSVCDGGKCTGGVALSCDDDNPCTDDNCEEPFGCRNVNHQRTCDDGDPCTLNDACSAGVCSGDAKRCEAAADACNVGSCDPETGACGRTPLPDGTPCDDANGCTHEDRCAAGSCGAELTSCGPHASACTSAEPANQCTCESGFVDNGRGRCVPENDECSDQSACAPDAKCDDPSNDAGDFVCTCEPGFSGDGRSCERLDPCAGNPCGEGRGSCVSGEPGSYSCTCEPGFIELNGSCACDMRGVFALRSQIELAWSETDGLLEAGSDTVNGYAIERFSYDAAGELVIEHLSCGEGALDLCGLGSAPTIAPEAYAPYIPTTVWDLPSIPRAKSRVLDATALVPGASFASEPAAHLHGISLRDPFGAWPASRRDISGSPSFDGSSINGARWLDQDDDGFVGLTAYLVPPGGSNDQIPPPPRAYAATSPICPRGGGQHTPYAYLPATAESATNVWVRVKRFFTASRVIASYRGTLTSCDTISGEIVGPDGAALKNEIRVGGCIRAYGETDTACNDAAVDFLDTAVKLQTTAKARFLLKRWPSDTAISCNAARALAYE